MSITKKDNLVNFYIDGNYAFGIWNHLRESKGIELDFEKMIDWVLRFTKEKYPETNPIFNSQSSYAFMGKAAWVDSLRDEFLHQLLRAGIDSKRRPLKIVNNRFSDGRKGYKEDGIDVLLCCQALYDAMSPAKENLSSHYDFLVMFAGDSDLVPSFGFFKEIGIKIIVLYYDINETNLPTSELIIDSADIAVNLASLMLDRKDTLAQAIFKQVKFSRKTKSNTPPLLGKNIQTQALKNASGTIKFIDTQTNAWGIIETDEGDYHFFTDSVITKGTLGKGQKVTFKVLKKALPNDETLPRNETNGKATDVMVIENSATVIPTTQTVTSKISETDLKKIVAGSVICENGFHLLSEVGAAYKFTFGHKPNRPIKEMLADYPSTFEFCNTPAAGVRIIEENTTIPQPPQQQQQNNIKVSSDQQIFNSSKLLGTPLLFKDNQMKPKDWADAHGLKVDVVMKLLRNAGVAVRTHMSKLDMAEFAKIEDAAEIEKQKRDVNSNDFKRPTAFESDSSAPAKKKDMLVATNRLGLKVSLKKVSVAK